MTYLSKKIKGINVVKRVFALAIILLCMTMISAAGCNKKVETKQAKPIPSTQRTQNNDLTAVKVSEEITEDNSEEDKAEKEVIASSGIIYDPEDRRDPFIPLIVPEKKEEKKKNLPQNAPPLESYDVKEFRLIATVASADNTFYALLVAPDKKSYTVTMGTKLGFHMGEIKEINMNEVIVEEYEEDHHNELQLKRVVLKLRRDDS